MKYLGYEYATGTMSTQSVETVGIDTEAYKNGRCFMICTSLGDVWTPDELPGCLFTRAGRDRVYVAYNLKYDESAILQKLPKEVLAELRKNHTVTFDNYTYRFISYKFLSIRHSKHTVTFYDMFGFFGGSLESNAVKYLDKKKIEVTTKKFTKPYVREHWNELVLYCIEDAKLVQQLSELLIHVFESYGVYPKKLYSTAYVSYQYFKSHCNYVTVKRFWNHHKGLLDYAMQSYNGGKFEVTQKGRGYYYDYDIISAYPCEIANLVDIRNACVVKSSVYRADAVYGFIDATMVIPYSVYSPVAVKVEQLCFFPVGEHRKVITKSEYEYLLSINCDVKINDAYWLIVPDKIYPYRDAINHLVAEKQKYSNDKKSLYYHTVKILMNSLYGKFVQLIKKGENWIASSCWNPIYASIITANTRIKVSRMQQLYPDVVAVHTDSVISLSKIPVPENPVLGDFKLVAEGDGVIVGSGVYQVGEESHIRGFKYKDSIMKLCNTDRDEITLKQTHVISWIESTIRIAAQDNINRFTEIDKTLHVRMDRKRIWDDDFKSFRDALSRRVSSLPIDAALLRLLR